MAVQIANPEVVKKIEWLAATLNTTKTAAVERALDAYQLNFSAHEDQVARQRRADEFMQRVRPILAKFDALPDANPNAKNDLDWDENGLPI
ncbi:MAG: type II toxin-antitoxin system VapB family antitoxin [Brachymonas sp.]|nr:type II toxin-antitoxin system VapB family antitoxin [Brachymonas sp.]